MQYCIKIIIIVQYCIKRRFELVYAKCVDDLDKARLPIIIDPLIEIPDLMKWPVRLGEACQ